MNVTVDKKARLINFNMVSPFFKKAYISMTKL